MRIDKIGSLSSLSKISSELAAKGAQKGQKPCLSDRVEIGTKRSVEDINQKISENIQKLEKQRVTPERLEEIKKKISQNSYYVSTEEIVKKMLS